MWLYAVNHKLGPLLGAYWRLELTGETATIPREGPLLVCANHASRLDPWFIGMCFPRPIRYLITDTWYHRSSVWKWFFDAWGTIPVAKSPHATLDAVHRHLEKGDVVGVFPEGEVSRDGRIQRFRPGTARIAARSGVPVIPVGLRGNAESLPRDGAFPRPVKVTVHVGEPIRFSGSPRDGVPPRDEVEAFNARLRESIVRLSRRPDAQRDGPPLPAEDGRA
jgi:1-acyl-sn-glycerol-3-phosphate acyltransferase